MSAFTYNDGGRAAAGFKGDTRDCVTRAVAIATGRPYKEVYDEVNARVRAKNSSGKLGSRYSARSGVQPDVARQYLKELGWEWVPTMKIGQGAKTHLRADELPGGTIIVKVSRHLAAVIDGVVQDTFDPSREGTRCVYGYWYKA